MHTVLPFGMDIGRRKTDTHANKCPSLLLCLSNYITHPYVFVFVLSMAVAYDIFVSPKDNTICPNVGNIFDYNIQNKKKGFLMSENVTIRLLMVCVLQLQPLSNLSTFCTNMPNIMIQFMKLQPESLNITLPMFCSTLVKNTYRIIARTSEVYRKYIVLICTWPLVE